MAKVKYSNVDIAFANGWIRGQMAAEDATDGSRNIVPGLLARLRLDTVLEYYEDDANVLIIITAHNPKGVSFYGKAETLDDIIARDALKEVKSHAE